ncbi:substrate-binding periplasmic protein [Thalassotalea ganghwensis]
MYRRNHLNMLRVVVICFCLLLLCLPTQGQDIKLRVLTEDLPPFQIDNGQKPPTGVLIDVVQLMLDEVGISATIELYPWARSYSLALHEPNTLIFSMLRSEEREHKFHWIAHLFTINSYFAALKTRSDISVNSIEEAKTYSVGSVRDDLAETYLLSKGFIHDKNLYVTSKYPVLWHMLFSGRTDLVFTNSVVWQHEVTATGLDKNMLKLVYQLPDFDTDLYLAASLTTDKAIVNKLKEAFARITTNGSYQNVMKRWHIDSIY